MSKKQKSVTKEAASQPKITPTVKTKETIESLPELLEGLKKGLSGKLIKDVDCSGVDLRAANFSGAELDGVKFCNCNLQGSNFSGAKLSKVDLEGADVRWSIGLDGS